MSKNLVELTAERIARVVDKVNPHARADLATRYELGLLRAILAQCILYDNRNEWIFDRVIERVVEKHGIQGDNRT
jgi:hypothetical protein